MDDKPNPTTQQSQTQPEAQAPASKQQAAPTQPPPNIVQQAASSNGNNKLVLWLIGGLVAIILVVGGLYFYLSSQQKAAAPSPAQSPKVEENLEGELDSLTIEDLDAEFSAVDKDLESL